MKKVRLAVHLSQYDDETSELCHWHIPQTHFLEEWGDARAYDGTVTIQQPLITPLYNGKSVCELLAAFTDNPDRRGYDIVRQYWLTEGRGALLAGASAAGRRARPRRSSGAPAPTQGGGTTAAPNTPDAPATAATSTAATASTAAAATPDAAFERAWRRALNDGFVANSARKPAGGGGGSRAARGRRSRRGDATAGPGAGPARRARGRVRDRLPHRPDHLRRALRQQRLVAGAAQALDEADVGQRRHHQPGHGRGARRRHRARRRARRRRAAPRQPPHRQGRRDRRGDRAAHVPRARAPRQGEQDARGDGRPRLHPAGPARRRR